MLNIDAENDEEDDDEDINNYLNNDEETMKMTIYKDFFGIIDKSYDIIISNTTTEQLELASESDKLSSVISEIERKVY